MVLKKSKFGGNTGNTLRKSCKGGYKTCATAAFISKQSYDMKSEFMNDYSPKVEWLENGMHSKKSINSLNSSQNVQFSLNKDKKWLLAEKLRCEVLDESRKGKPVLQPLSKKSRKYDVTDNHARVAIIEKSSPSGLHRNSLSMISFINSADEGNNRKSKSWNGPLHIPVDIRESMDVTYTIESTIDSKCWMYHSDRTCYKPRNKKSTGNFDNFDNFEDMQCYDDYVYDYSDEEVDNECVDDISYTRETISLDMFIKSKATKKDKHNNHNSIVDNHKNAYSDVETRFEKGSYIIIDKPSGHFETNVIQKKTELWEVENEDTVPSTSHSARQSSCEKTYKEVECKVNQDEVSSEYLTKRFGDRYIEGRCTPRQFIIFNEDFSSNGIIVSVRVLSEKYMVSTISIKVMNITTDFLLCMGELFQQDVLNFEFLIDSCFPNNMDVIKISNNSKTTTFHETAIERMFKPNADLIRMNDICRELFTQQLTCTNKYYTNSYPAVCPICYSIDILICMKDCSHFACGTCLGMYINTKASSGCYNILCPEAGCEGKVDKVTIVCFLDYKFVNMFIQKYCTSHIQRRSAMKFCPSRDCSMVAVYKESHSAEKMGDNSMEKSANNIIANVPCVRCDCNFSWCFNCQQSDHWPSSCFANKAYQRRKKKDYDLIYDMNGNVNETEVLYRPCPICKNPIMKGGGCNHMSCICGSQFCWNCLQRYNNHRDDLCTPAKDVSITFSSYDMFSGGSRTRRMQGKALEFSSSAKKVSSLRQKLKINKISYKLQYSDHNPNFLVVTASNACTLLIRGYKLLENLSAAAAVCQSKHTSAHIMKFVNMFSFVLKLLHTSVDVNQLSRIKIGSVTKNIQSVQTSLDDLAIIGLGKKCVKLC